MFSTILVFLSVLALVLLYAINRSANAKLYRIRNVNTGQRAPGYSVFQTFYMFYKRRTYYIPDILSQSKELGPFYCSYLFKPIVTISDPFLIKEVLKKMNYFPKLTLQNEGNLHLRRIFELEKKFLGSKGLNRVNSDKWRHQRSLFNVGFLSNKEFFEPVVKKVKLVLSKWHSPGIEVKIGEDLKKMTLDIIGECFLGCNETLLNVTDFYFIFSNYLSPIRFLVPFYSDLPLPINWKLKKCINEFDAYCWKIINEAKQKNFAEDQKRSLIDLMIASSKDCESGLSDQEIRANVSIIGTAAGLVQMLTWIIGMLVTHPEIQKKARREVLETIPGDLTFDDLKHVEYVDWIIKEIFRIHPTVPILDRRETASDIVLGEWFIPANTLVHIDLVTCMRDPKIWGDPFEFRPERWSYITKEQRAAWMPFSYGPRVCVAKGFVLMMLKIFLVYLLKYFSEFKMGNGSVLQVKTSSPTQSLDLDKIKIVFTKE